MMSLTTGASSCLSVLWPRAPLLKLTTILMTVGFPVTMSWTWSTLDLKQMQKKLYTKHNTAFSVNVFIGNSKLVCVIYKY